MTSITYSLPVSKNLYVESIVKQIRQNVTIWEPRWSARKSVTFLPRTHFSRSPSYHSLGVRAVGQLAVLHKPFLVEVLLRAVRAREGVTVWDIPAGGKGRKKERHFCEYMPRNFSHCTLQKGAKFTERLWQGLWWLLQCQVKCSENDLPAQLVSDVNIREAFSAPPPQKHLRRL